MTSVLYYKTELVHRPVGVLETCELNLSIRILEKTTDSFVSYVL